MEFSAEDVYGVNICVPQKISSQLVHWHVKHGSLRRRDQPGVSDSMQDCPVSIRHSHKSRPSILIMWLASKLKPRER